MTAAATVVLAKALKRKIQVNPMAKPQEKSLYLCSQSFSRAASPFCAGKDKEEKAPKNARQKALTLSGSGIWRTMSPTVAKTSMEKMMDKRAFADEEIMAAFLSIEIAYFYILMGKDKKEQEKTGTK